MQYRTKSINDTGNDELYSCNSMNSRTALGDQYGKRTRNVVNDTSILCTTVWRQFRHHDITWVPGIPIRIISGFKTAQSKPWDCQQHMYRAGYIQLDVRYIPLSIHAVGFVLRLKYQTLVIYVSQSFISFRAVSLILVQLHGFIKASEK